jgi:hypothetical protein
MGLRSLVGLVAGIGKAEQAYRRGDALDKRRTLMDAWTAYCEPGRLNNVVSIGSKNRK